MVAINGAGFDWSYMVDDEVPTNMTLMDFLDSKFNKSEFKLATYKRGLTYMKEQLVFYKKNEVIFCKQLADLKRDISNKDSELSMHKRLLSPPNFDLSKFSLEEFQQPEFEGYGPKTSKSVSEKISKEVKESPDTLLVKKLVLDDKLEKKSGLLQLPSKGKGGSSQKEDQGYVLMGYSSTRTGTVLSLRLEGILRRICYLWEEPKEEKLLNRVLVVKPYNKTFYELFRGRTPALSFMRLFGCHVTILNILDYLGKFDAKSDE
ncbi:hypothetical protein Tco_0748711 [Tanacetum coccineum]|uniref:Uncharacterized protein n=1 Tax=Tanacetum coccineum TaxID=301880 RepID=A0ABQ4YWL2_9ASTR